MDKRTRTWAGVLLALLLIFSASSPVAATATASLPAERPPQQVAGTWNLTVELDVGQGGVARFVLTVDEDEISGTYSGALGEALPVTGAIAEEGIVFRFESQAGEIVYRGKVEGKSMEGTCEYGQLGSGTFKGEREE